MLSVSFVSSVTVVQINGDYMRGQRSEVMRLGATGLPSSSNKNLQLQFLNFFLK